MLVIFPIVFYLLNTTPLPHISNHQVTADSENVIYLVKIRWHTGIVFRTDRVDTTIWKSISDFKNYKYVDVGWGDKDFYQHPGFDVDLAVRALFIKTNTTLRIGGFNRPVENYINSTDYAEKLFLSKVKYDRLCSFIQSTYELENDSTQILSERFGGAVKFYKAKGYYTCFNTCNTWIAKALKYSGYNIDTNIILSEQLFRETVRYGELVKLPE
jgi:uncharacterized protein (TIGR02117 family)